MRTRLLASLAGGLLGMALASPIQAGLKLGPAVALIGCTAAGTALGYVVSMFVHVFTMSPDGDN